LSRARPPRPVNTSRPTVSALVESPGRREWQASRTRSAAVLERASRFVDVRVGEPVVLIPRWPFASRRVRETDRSNRSPVQWDRQPCANPTGTRSFQPDRGAVDSRVRNAGSVPGRPVGRLRPERRSGSARPSTFSDGGGRGAWQGSMPSTTSVVLMLENRSSASHAGLPLPRTRQCLRDAGIAFEGLPDESLPGPAAVRCRCTRSRRNAQNAYFMPGADRARDDKTNNQLYGPPRRRLGRGSADERFP